MCRNLIEPYQTAASQRKHSCTCVRGDRTSSDCIFTGDRRSKGALCTSYMRFKHSEPQRSYLNYILSEIAWYRDFFHTSSGWFDWTEPSPTTSVQRKDTRCAGSNIHQFREIQAHRSSSNLLYLHHHRDSKVFRFLLHKFGVVRGPNLL